MIVYFAGVNQIHFCEAFRGRHILESFADQRPLFGRYRATFAGVGLDCGAFSDKSIDIGAYAAFVHEHGEFYDWVASLDSIRGGVSENLSNWQDLRDRGINAMPTFHQGEPIAILRAYCEQSARVALGFQRPIQNARAFLDEAFSNIPPHVKVHGWAMTNYTARYPFASVDSTSWLHELKALRATQTTQQGEPFAHLTDGELIDIIQKRYDRLPRMKLWQARPYSKQLGLLKESA